MRRVLSVDHPGYNTTLADIAIATLDFEVNITEYVSVEILKVQSKGNMRSFLVLLKVYKNLFFRSIFKRRFSFEPPTFNLTMIHIDKNLEITSLKRSTNFPPLKDTSPNL